MPRKATTAPRKAARTAPEFAPAVPKPHTPPELDSDFFATLISERIERTREQIDTLTAVIREVTLAAKDIPADDEHDPEGTTVSVERANEVALLAAAETSLVELLDAQVRLEANAYGICESCASPIPAARLEIRPETRFCVGCAAARRR